MTSVGQIAEIRSYRVVMFSKERSQKQQSVLAPDDLRKAKQECHIRLYKLLLSPFSYLTPRIVEKEM